NPLRYPGESRGPSTGPRPNDKRLGFPAPLNTAPSEDGPTASASIYGGTVVELARCVPETQQSGALPWPDRPAASATGPSSSSPFSWSCSACPSSWAASG